jgi:tRNA1Val (adenine37-N6)-methyltransferase
MPKNSFFQFKQFRIEQGNCGMKVSTDACLFGAYLPVENAQKILDIGTGTGLLALMMAQRSSARIDAVEIDEAAAQQAQHNFQQSQWRDRLSIFQSSIQDFCKQTPAQQYDWVVSNPPFFVNATLSANEKRKLARHTVTLSFEDLWQSVQHLLTPDGKFAALLPPTEMQLFMNLGEKLGYFPHHIAEIQDTPQHKIHRQIVIFEQNPPKQVLSNNLCIKEAVGKYSPTVKSYISAYYLYE